MAIRVHRFLPSRLPPPTNTQLTWIRGLWFVALALAVVLDIAGTVFVLRDTYRNDPQFHRLSLTSQVENDGSITVESIPGNTGVPVVPAMSRITAIDGKPVAQDTPVWDLAARLKGKDGQVVALTLASPEGQSATHRIEVSPRYAAGKDASQVISRDQRMTARMFISLLTCMTLIGCAVLLFLRRPQDPVALLFSFSFLLFAGSIDPPLNLWLATGMGNAFDVYTTLAWALLVIGIAAFPDGRFTPRVVRWILVIAPLLMVPLAIDEIPTWINVAIAFILPLFLLICHVIKYRRFQPGIERQQVKWAAFGFASGLLSLTLAFVLVDVLEQSPINGLIVIVFFNLGFLAMAIGLLISLLRFRLWEADRVISRSAISAVVTLAVGIVWTLSMDFLKLGAEWVLGRESETAATLAGAILAAGIFAPTQALAMRWAKKRLAGDESRIQKLVGRLHVWRTTEMPEEIGVRTLSALSAAVHCSGAALLVDGPRGPQLLAARDIEQADELGRPSYDPVADPRFPLTLPLEDEDGPIGQLLIGPRSDFNRYNAAQLDGLKAMTEPLAETLRASLKRAQQAESINLQMGSVEERLARLEQSGPRLSPT
ncbi:hypothetical protein [Altererythrobacter sp. Root672]|uniref:hypothetical protein n=1 Tax=Altererythrobacter sp. Root672 TaxID=1736584 RepID=UPI000700819B|nr:hypothetical protein [Altererythrobacter sp. Root672]KRA82961.1 hypothetical protein ASD76_02420 [Altererythrobacter sp. Root672]